MLEIFPHALDRQGFLGEVLFLDLMAPADDPFFIAPRGINLPDPPGIPVAGRPDQDVLREIAEEEAFFPALSIFGHDFILPWRIKRAPARRRTLLF